MIKHAIITLLICITANSYADDFTFSDLTEPAYGLWGIGAINRNLNYEDVNSETSITPFILGGYGPVFIEANRAGTSIYQDGTYFASIVGQLRTHEFREADDVPEFSSLGDRNRAIEAGLQAGIRLGSGFFTRLAFLHDISGKHDSHEFDLQVYRRDNFSGIQLLTAVGIQYQDKDLVNYYYGTEDYVADDALVAELELIATYAIGDWGIFAGTRTYWFDNEINDSPLTDGNRTIQIFTGIGYYF